MNVMVFDTETTDLEKCFCYDIGYVIMDTDDGDILCERHFIIEQIWHNLPLFESAYYKDKREQYVYLLRSHKAEMTKFGYALQQMKRDIATWDIHSAYAYNSNFDDKVFAYNCNWYHLINPLETLEVYDIWGYASQFITCQQKYKNYCEEHELFTDTGNYKGSAESVYQFLTNDETFVEKHMGLYDAQIESQILYEAVSKYGANWDTEYKVNKILARPTATPFTIKVDNEVIYEGEYAKKYVRNNVYSFTTPQ